MVKKNIVMKGGGEQMDEIQHVVYKEICPYCRKEFKSLYKEQLEYNFGEHKKACRKNKSSKNENDKKG